MTTCRVRLEAEQAQAAPGANQPRHYFQLGLGSIGRQMREVDASQLIMSPGARGSASVGRRAESYGDGSRADVHKLPLVGEIAAGGPLLAEDNIEEYLAVPEPLSRGGAEFLLRVKGESMINAGILDGDIIVVRKQQDARDGDIVVALAGDDETTNEATVKRLFRDGDRVRLQPENDAFEPIYADHVELIGKVIGVFRQL